MRTALALLLGAATLGVDMEASAVRPAGDGRFGLAAGFVVPTVLLGDGDRIPAEPGPMVLITFDRPVDPFLPPDLEIGGFLHVGALTAGEREEQVNYFCVGAALHWARLAQEGPLFRIGGGLGYRRTFADAARLDAVQGVALNLDARVDYTLDRGLVGQAELGVLSQPWGSNGEHELQWLPFPYLAIGVVF